MKSTLSRVPTVAASRRPYVLGTAAAAIALICSALAGAGTAAAAGRPASTATFLFRGVLRGVAATSASNAWAVGCTTYNCYDKTDKPLILHWNGRTWQRQDPRALADVLALYGVAAASARDVWAVGQTRSGRTVILHWNGRTWSRVPSPDPLAEGDFLQGVTALSARSAWAVGWGVPSGGGFRELTMHWNGKAWKVVPSPSLIPPTVLNAVAATSDHSAWAVGSFEGNNGASGSLILHWNGARWKQMSSPDPPDRQAGGGAGFLAVAASARTAWAVGYGYYGALIAGWSGSAWKAAADPAAASAGWLAGAAVTSARNAWAVGWGSTGTLIARWSGTTWRQVPTPRSGAWDALLAVAAPSAASAWAVGYQCLASCPDEGQTDAALILRWNDSAWSRVPVSLSSTAAASALAVAK
jgi:hypothetical protein